MPSPVELALASLLPTVSFLPPDLISLASSLLAQSRAKAASLKPDEEIGRTYACAHIACNRSAKRFDLEIGKPVPPVKPRVYDKLYKYLDSALTTPRQQNAPRTPQTNRLKNVDSAVKSTGGRSCTTARETEKPKLTESKKRPREEERAEDAPPDFAMSMVRAICKATETPAAVPHILVGAKAAVKEIASRTVREVPSKRRRRTPQSAHTETRETNDALSKEKWAALIVAIYCVTAARMKGIASDDDEYDALKKEAIQAVEAYIKMQKAEGAIVIGLAKMESNVRFYMLEAEDAGWLDMDWYKNVPEDDVAAEQDDYEIPESDQEQDDDQATITPRRSKTSKTPLRRKEKHGGKSADSRHEDIVGAAGLLPGLATMFQPAVDWLSEDRRRDFALWKKAIMKEIATLEARG